MDRSPAKNPPPPRKKRGIIPLLAILLVLLAVSAVRMFGTSPAIPSAESQSLAASSAEQEAASAAVPSVEIQSLAESSAEQEAASAASRPADEPTPEPEQVAAELTAEQDAAGRAYTDWLVQNAGLTEEQLTVNPAFPYLLCVNRAANTVTVLTDDGTGRYTRPYSAMICSTGGEKTPTGVFATPVAYDWRLLSGDVYGQYAVRINGPYLFHSVPYYTKHKDDLEYDEFNKLGTSASLGCVRLMVCDVKWIYNCCPLGTTVIIYDNEDDPGPLGKPEGIPTDPADEKLRGWDPTDPDPANPWGTQYQDGTTLRTAAAQADWDARKAAGGLQAALTPTNLQGFSQDSALVGTRG